MKAVLTVLKRLLYPPKWALALLPPAVFTALVGVLAGGQTDSAPAYAVYGLSAYCLTIWTLPLPGLWRKMKAKALRRLNSTAFGRRFLQDPAFRGSVSLYRGMTVNFLYVAFRAAVGVWYGSVWFISMAVYYLVLGGMRLRLIRGFRRQNAQAERRCYRQTAWLLFVLNVPMGGMILQMTLTDAGYVYPGYVIYLSALHAFYTLILSAVQLTKCRRLGSPVLAAARALDFVAALMSLLGLQTAMLTQFSARGPAFRVMMNAVTGGGVWAAVIATAAAMLLGGKAKEEKAP